MLVKEQAEEVCWLLFTVSLHLHSRAEVWRVELTGVLEPYDVVKEAGKQKDGDITINWPDANISDFQVSLSGLSHHCPFCPIQ